MECSLSLFSFFRHRSQTEYMRQMVVPRKSGSRILEHKVVETYRSGEYGCNNCGNGRCPCIYAGTLSLPAIPKFN